MEYYHRDRVHLALEKDTPEPQPIQPPECGRIVSMPVLGGLHHRYERRAAAYASHRQGVDGIAQHFAETRPLVDVHGDADENKPVVLIAHFPCRAPTRVKTH